MEGTGALEPGLSPGSSGLPPHQVSDPQAHQSAHLAPPHPAAQGPHPGEEGATCSILCSRVASSRYWLSSLEMRSRRSLTSFSLVC